MRWEWKMFLAVFMLWITKNCAAYLTTPDASQLKDYGPSMTYKDLNPGWDPNRRLQ